MVYKFNNFSTSIDILQEIPSIKNITGDLNVITENVLIIADENTLSIAEKIRGSEKIPFCLLKSGEENKTWQSVESILAAAKNANLGRDAVFLGVGGGVLLDLCGFAASIYKRGCRLAFVSTTLLAMVDASVGGKTGFDLFGIKNIIGTFYPASAVYMPLDSLKTLPEKEWKNGFAELIKTAVLAGGDFFEQIVNNKEQISGNSDFRLPEQYIKKAVEYKASVVSEDLYETGKRTLLNLGHTFAHALESTAGLGQIPHGAAVAWGMVRACELGAALGITPPQRADKIKDLISFFDYETSCPYPEAYDTESMLSAINNDKKNKNKKITFIVPDNDSACPVILETEDDMKLLKKILSGRIND